MHSTGKFKNKMQNFYKKVNAQQNTVCLEKQIDSNYLDIYMINV